MHRLHRISRHGFVLLGTGLVAAVAVADAVASSSAVLIPVLVVGPLTTAIRSGPRATALVAVLAFAVAVGLGEVDGSVLSGQHVVQLIAVGLGGALAVVAAAARSRSEVIARAVAALLALERRERVRSEFLGRASRLLEAQPEPERMLDEVVRLAVPDMAEICIVDLLSADGTLRGAAVHAQDPAKAAAVRESRTQFPLDPDSEHPVVIALREGTPRLIPELLPEDQRRWATNDEHFDSMTRQPWGTAMIVPLIARGHRLGVLSLARFAGAPSYDAADLSLASEIGRRAALALDNARLFAELIGTERQLEAVLENLAEAVTVQSPDGRLLYLNQAAARSVECETPDEALALGGAELVNRFVLLDEHGHPFDFAELPGRRVLSGEDRPEPVLTRSISKATGEERWVLIKATAVRGDDGEIALAVNIMEDVTEERRAARQQRFLAAASTLMSSSLEIEATLERVAWAVVPEVADWCRVDLLDDRGVLRPRALAAGEDQRAALERLSASVSHDPGNAGALSGVVSSSASVLVADVERDFTAAVPSDREALDALVASGTRSLLCVPLRAGARSIGAITLGTSHSVRRLGAEELALAEGLGRRAGIAVENARLHAARTHIATTLQRSLLPPQLPLLPGVTSAARFRAAGETVEVGGDFYDIFAVDGGWMVVVGDVTGKGPTAAATTSLARYTMRTAAMYEPSPAALLGRLNAALAADPEPHQLCTAVCVRVEVGDVDGARLTVACGGHPPPLHVRARGEVVALGRPGPLLGAFERANWSEQHVELAPGETIVLYTDGVTDTRGADGRFGGERLTRLLADLGELDADAIAARIDEALLAFEQGPQRDDVALVVLQADASASVPAAAVSRRGA